MADRPTTTEARPSRDRIDEWANRARKVLTDDLPAGHKLWKSWALDLADQVLALIRVRDDYDDWATRNSEGYTDAATEADALSGRVRELEAARERIVAIVVERLREEDGCAGYADGEACGECWNCRAWDELTSDEARAAVASPEEREETPV